MLGQPQKRFVIISLYKTKQVEEFLTNYSTGINTTLGILFKKCPESLLETIRENIKSELLIYNNTIKEKKGSVVDSLLLNFVNEYCKNISLNFKKRSEEKDYFLFEEFMRVDMKIIHEAIGIERNNIPYSSSQFTIIHKESCYQAFENLLQKHPAQVTQYRLYKKRAGFQAKLFQEYIKVLEKRLPFSYLKGGKVFQIKSLLDPNLSIFDGISVFDTFVNMDGEIENNTQEFYFNKTQSEPYFIGKLIDIKGQFQQSLMSSVKEYSFNKIKTNLPFKTNVTVTHLRIVPHYQMGGMVYINRAKEKIRQRIAQIKQGANDLVFV